jgi:macrodomain Ter protein organizer (MatP/YcbG family)
MNYQLLEDIESELKWQQILSNEDMELGAFSM